MKMMIRITGWGAVFAALALLFYLLPSAEAQAAADSRTTLSLLTETGVETLSLAEYLPGAVAAEMPAAFGGEALKAQAVAARTYVLSSHRHEDANVCTDSSCCLAYRTEDELRTIWGEEFDKNMQTITDAVHATDGQVLIYDGEMIEAAFHASSAGATEDSGSLWTALPYLISVESPENAENVPGLVSEAAFTPAELCERLDLLPDGAPEDWIGKSTPDASGRVAYISIGGRLLSGAAVRTALGLKSAAFSARYENGLFIFTAVGSGHGVGMSQYGAKLLAADGWSYDAILAHYYPGTSLMRLARPRG